MLTRRQMIERGGIGVVLTAGVLGAARTLTRSSPNLSSDEKLPILSADVATVKIRIATSIVELGKDTAISTKTYNGQFPGPLIRFSEGKSAVVEIHNDTDIDEQLHWHGQYLGTDIDGASEEGTPFIPAHGKRRIAFLPKPAGFRYYHTHMTAGVDLEMGLYNGQAGPVYIDPKHNRGAYDREIFLTLKEFGPYLNHMEMGSGFLLPKEKVSELYDLDQIAVNEARRLHLDPGFELAYNFFTINGRMLGEGDPIRVKQGERVLFHLLNASATEIRSLALPGHVFTVIALDGNPVPRPATVSVLYLAPAERICAIVEMTTPGVWVLGDLDDDARTQGMGIVVEYASQSGEPQWETPAPSYWDYRAFALPGAVAQVPDDTIEMTFGTRYASKYGFNEFTINGKAFSMTEMEPKFHLTFGRRYRLKMRNATDDVHPIHLHRHSFEITSVAGMPTAGVIKDVAMIGGFQEMTVDFTADQRGLSLFHCHMQSHMDFGFMALFVCD